jgi:exodeoxyribonuclease VIII
MIDLETLGTTADAVIVSIGAVRFDLETGFVGSEHSGPLGDTFYRVVRLDQQPGRSISGSTVAWWMGQTDAARAVFAAPKSFWLNSTLDDLRNWVARHAVKGCEVWSNGADFDLPMLNLAYAAQGREAPWKPYSGRCYRTYKNLPGARAVKVERQGTHHNALEDAIYQARHLCAIYRALFGKLVESPYGNARSVTVCTTGEGGAA